MTTTDKQVEELTNRVLILEKMVAYLLYTEPRDEDDEIDNPYPNPLALADPDPLFDEAWKIISDAGKASTSYLQRRMSLGYNRSAKIMEQLEREGVIGPAEGVNPRVILKTFKKNDTESSTN